MSTDTQNSLFPEDPTHGMLFEQKNGVVYQYDISIKAWIKIASDNINLPKATPGNNGAMSASDFKKLNRLVIPPPTSTIVGNDCVAPYRQGVINLYSGDNFVSVNGSLGIQNIDQYGDYINKDYPYQIHEHTYGFNFTLDIKQLVEELEKRGQLRLTGKSGAKGEQGEKGDPGINGILTGPQGDDGTPGTAPQCNIAIEPETFLAQIKPGLKRALTNARVIPDNVDNRKYYLEFDRQVVGNTSASASQFNVRQVNSTWVLAVAASTDNSSTENNLKQCGTPGERRDQIYSIYYLDIEPIISTIEQKYQDEVQRLKKGYEDIVAFWIRTMSDLFDEQKAALGCALERCMSLTKSTDLRQHMESTAAAVVGKAKINLHNRDSDYAVELSSTRLLHQAGVRDLCKSGPPFPQNSVANQRANTAITTSSAELNLAEPNIASIQTESVSLPLLLTIDPLINSSASNALQAALPAGQYVASIKHTSAQVNGVYKNNVKIKHNTAGEYKAIQFLDKGTHSSLIEAQQAYEGLTLAFDHDGGNIEIYLPSIQPRQYAGDIQIVIDKQMATKTIKNRKHTVKKSSLPKQVQDGQSCHMSASHLAWYKNGWETGRCCGTTATIGGQEYIIFKRSIGQDNKCGGGESQETPCIAAFNVHPSFAWPTLDGSTFAPIPESGMIYFKYDKELHNLINSKIDSSKLELVLFPMVS